MPSKFTGGLEEERSLIGQDAWYPVVFTSFLVSNPGDIAVISVIANHLFSLLGKIVTMEEARRAPVLHSSPLRRMEDRVDSP
jgi:hypothetical protein